MMAAMSRMPHGPGFEEKGIASFLFNFDQFEKLDEIGLFDDREGRVELIEGTLIEMAPPGFENTIVTSDLFGQVYVALEKLGIRDLRALTQGTVQIADHSGPEPDVFVARAVPGRKYFQAEDCVLVVEVSITTLLIDQSVKRAMYARAGIPELWIVEPRARAVHVHRQPKPDGTWDDELTVTEGAVSPLFAPEMVIALDDVFRSL